MRVSFESDHVRVSFAGLRGTMTAYVVVVMAQPAEDAILWQRRELRDHLDDAHDAGKLDGYTETGWGKKPGLSFFLQVEIKQYNQLEEALASFCPCGTGTTVTAALTLLRGK